MEFLLSDKSERFVQNAKRFIRFRNIYKNMLKERESIRDNFITVRDVIIAVIQGMSVESVFMR